ncbi:MAG: hypothetical protein ACE5IY_20590 [bacterium]
MSRVEHFFYRYVTVYITGIFEDGIIGLRGSIKEDVYPDLWYCLLGSLYHMRGDYENASLILEKHIEVRQPQGMSVSKTPVRVGEGKVRVQCVPSFFLASALEN